MVTRRGIRRTNPNGNTIGRVIGETSPMPVAAKAANPGIAPETEEEQAFLAKIGNWLAEQGENLEAAARHPFGALKGFAKDVGNTPAALLNLVSVMGVAQVGADMRTQAYSGHSGHLSPEEQQAAYEAGTRLMTNPTDVALLVDEPFPLANAAEHGGALIGNLNPKGVIRHAASNAGKNSAKSGTKSVSTSKSAGSGNSSSTGRNAPTSPTGGSGPGGNGGGKVRQTKRRPTHRCELVPYNELICGKNQEAHHVVPDWMLRLGKRGGKARIPGMPSLAEGPAICLEKGSGKAHRTAHKHTDRPAQRIARNGRSTGTPGTLKQGQARTISSRAIEKATGGQANGGCDRKDINAQLGKYFTAPNDSLLRGVYDSRKVTDGIKKAINPNQENIKK